MSGLRIVDGAATRVDDAALIWAAATAARDGDDEVAGLNLARPVIEGVLARSLRALLLVAVDDTDRAVGFVAAEPVTEPVADDGRAELSYLGVHPDAWGLGVGRALMAELPARLAAAGYTEAQLLVYVDNAPAVRLYERYGWRRHGSPTVHPRSGRLEQRYVLDPLTG